MDNQKRGCVLACCRTIITWLAGLFCLPCASGQEYGANWSLHNRVEQLEAEVQSLRSARTLAPLPPLADQGYFEQVSPTATVEDPPGLPTSSHNVPYGERDDFIEEKLFPTVTVGGFFQADAAGFHQDAANLATLGDIQDGADFRRARLNAHGDVWDNVGYMIEFDFAFPGRPSFMDVYLDLRDTSAGTLRVGHWRQPFGMDGQTSVKDLTFLERALPFAFLPFRQIGVGIRNYTPNESATWAFSLFRFPTDLFGGNVGDSGGFGLANRFSLLPWQSEDGTRLVHVGLGYVFVDPSNNQTRYASPPEFFVAQNGSLVPPSAPSAIPLFVDTGPIPTENFHQFGVESGLLLGPAHVQSEVIYVVVNQIGAPVAVFSGAYAQFGYVLTGESRQYNRKNGVFGRVIPASPVSRHGGRGAWELAARWSYLDLNNKNIAGGRLNDTTLGINWYLNPRTKFQFNFIHAFLNDPTSGRSDADVFACRVQVDF